MMAPINVLIGRADTPDAEHPLGAALVEAIQYITAVVNQKKASSHLKTSALLTRYTAGTYPTSPKGTHWAAIFLS